MVTDKDTAHKLVMRHITSGTLFSTGMRFYQVRDSLQAGNAITLQKVNQGKLNKCLFLCWTKINRIVSIFQVKLK